MGNIKENKETMMEKQGKSEYNMGWQKTLVFQSRKPVVKFQQTHSILDFFHFNHHPRVFKTFDLNRRNPRNRIDTILISFIKRSILREIKRFRFNLHSSHQFHKPKIQLVRDYLSTRDDFIFWINSCVKKKKKKKKKSLSKSSARFFFSTINMINGPFSTFTFTSFESSRFKRHGGSFKKTTKI